MFKSVVCVASRDRQRLLDFIGSFDKTVNRAELLLCIVVTGNRPKLVEDLRLLPNTDVFATGSDAPMRYAQVVQQKVQMVDRAFSKFEIDANAFYWNYDDDYVFNPHWWEFASYVIGNVPTADYVSLLKVPSSGEHNINVGKFLMAWTPSSMGGSFGARWSSFRPLTREFFMNYGTNNMFDQQFWALLKTKTGNPNNILMPQNFSLVQHCNRGSHYINEKANSMQHMYGLDFDPMCDPLALAGLR